MRELEVLLILVLAAVMLAALARRLGAPYPVFLALGGALLAFVPGAPSFTVPPELALALFIAPVLLDAAYDASPRDLKDNWAPLTSLVIFAVGLTTAAVAVVVRTLLLSVAGSLVGGAAVGWLVTRLIQCVQHVPTSIILQFVSTFAVWILSDRIGLSGVLTMVCYALVLARTSPERVPARIRIPAY